MTGLKRAAGTIGIVAVALGTGGCLQQGAAQRWYLDANGALTWQITEQDVRSDADSATERQSEELVYMSAVRSQGHPVALGFGAIGGMAPVTRILRSAAPFTVVTEARFASLSVLGERILTATGTPGTSTLERTPDGLTWTLRVFDVHDSDGGDEAVTALLTDFEHLKVVLIDGQFTAAQGFDLSTDRRVATLTAFDGDHHDGDGPKPVVMSLTWTGR